MNQFRIFLLFLGVSSFSSGFASVWQDMWTTRDQQGMQSMEKKAYKKAEQLFQRKDWRATAAYRAGQYQQAAQYYMSLQTADGFYNAGNALVQLSKYPQALQAYDQAIAKNPRHQDALFNRKLVQNLIKQQKKQDHSKNNSDKSKQNADSTHSKNTTEKEPSKTSTSSASNKSTASQEEFSQEPVISKKKKQAAPPKTSKALKDEQSSPQMKPNHAKQEQQQAKQQWLRLIPDDPGGLLREKFLRDHLRRQEEEGR